MWRLYVQPLDHPTEYITFTFTKANAEHCEGVRHQAERVDASLGILLYFASFGCNCVVMKRR